MGQKGTHSYIWAPIGARPLMVRDNRHESAYLFGAICPDRALGAAIIMPHVNAEAISEHLAEISTQVTPGYDAIVEACVTAWHFLINDPDRIRSIGTREWARFSA